MYINALKRGEQYVDITYVCMYGCVYVCIYGTVCKVLKSIKFMQQKLFQIASRTFIQLQICSTYLYVFAYVKLYIFV